MIFPVSVVLVLIIFISSVFLYKQVTKNYDFFLRRGIPFSKPKLLFGSSMDFYFKKIELIEFIKRLYYEMPNQR